MMWIINYRFLGRDEMGAVIEINYGSYEDHHGYTLKV